MAIATGFRDIREYIEHLDSKGLLTRVTAEVDLKHEIGAICAMSLDRKGPGLLFENIAGYPGMSLVANILSTTEQLAAALDAPADQDKIYERIVWGTENRIESKIVPTGPCKEVIDTGEDVDLYKFPTPWWHELDGGQYIGTTSACITKDPDTGVHNMGNYRVMIKDKNSMTMNAGASRNGVVHHLRNEARGVATPFALALSMDPFLTLASGTPVPEDESGWAEYEAAGAWRGAPTELVRCETSDLLVPANAEIIIEGELLPNVRWTEGPHGESQGFYGHNPEALAIKVKCITHRRQPVSYGLICRVVEDYPRALVRSGLFEQGLIEKSGLKSIKRAFLADVGRLGILIVAAQIPDADEPKRIMDAAWKHTNVRWVIVVDEDCDVRNWDDVMWRVAWAVIPRQHVVQGPIRDRSFGRGGDGDVPPPDSGMGIDATLRFKNFGYSPVNTISQELRTQVLARWEELGLR